jgi:hypothetical protein
MNSSHRAKKGMALLFAVSVAAACAGTTVTSPASMSVTDQPRPSRASASGESSPSVRVIPDETIAADGTAGPPPDPSYLPAKQATCAPGSALALDNGKILTWDGCWTVFDPATGIFTPTGSTTIPFQPDYQPPNPAVLLKSGQVYFPNGEIYDPSTGRFYPIPVKLASSTATLLHDGRILVLAYETTDPNEYDANHVAPEIYDPRTGQATPTGAMPAKVDGLAVTLADGHVLVLGSSTQALLYDPSTNTFAETGSMLISPSCITSLQDGRWLVAGDPDSRIAEVYDPRAGQFAKVAPMARLMAGECATLADGRVLALGTVGSDQDSTAGPLVYSAQIYDPKANHWTNLGRIEPKLYGPALIALPDGRAVVLGGDNDTAQFFDPKTNKFVANS